MKTIYLDNNATTKVAKEVLQEMLPYFETKYGNASSIHGFGGNVGKKLTEARAKVADLIGAEPGEIIFTSCGSESDNTAIMSALESFPHKKHIITTAVEHPAVYELCKYLQKEKGYRVTFLPVDEDGQISVQDLKKTISKDTAIVSIMYANNETGNIYPVEEAAKIAKQNGVLFHTDAVQAVGKIPIDLKNSAIDMLSLSGHKLHAPKGIGVLYVRKGTPFVPFLKGGHQERGRRAGTENVPYIVGLGKACELAKKNITKENEKVKELRDYLESEIIKKIPNIRINAGKAERLPNTLDVSFKYIEGEAILLNLDEYGIAASSGSACTSGSLEPSHVLMAMKVPFTFAHGSIRFSLSVYNTKEEIDFVLGKLPGIIDKLRKMSPFGQEENGKSSK
jgi:cysteine desulfurase